MPGYFLLFKNFYSKDGVVKCEHHHLRRSWKRADMPLSAAHAAVLPKDTLDMKLRKSFEVRTLGFTNSDDAEKGSEV